MREKLEKKIENCEEFQFIIKDLLQNETVQEMKKYRQHFETNCFEHCLLASYYCYKICKILKLDYKSAARGAMLHDFFLYDWREKNSIHKFHAFNHGKVAYENATKLFELNKIEKDMIIKHMWPVTLPFPKYFETLILTFVDKHCALEESFEAITSCHSLKKSLHYAYIFIFLLLFKKK